MIQGNISIVTVFDDPNATDGDIQRAIDGITSRKADAVSDFLFFSNGNSVVFDDSRNIYRFDGYEEIAAICDNKARGEWLSILNAGDVYSRENALCELLSGVDGSVDAVVGRFSVFDRNINLIKHFTPDNCHFKLDGDFIIYSSILVVRKRALSGISLERGLYARIIKPEQCRVAQVDVDFVRVSMSLKDAQRLFSGLPFDRGGKSTTVKSDTVKKHVRNVATYAKIIPRAVYYFFKHYFMNYIIANFPVYCIRKAYYRMFGMTIGKTAEINMKLYVLTPENISIGEHTHINHGVFLDGRNTLKIGNNVSISHYVSILTGTHDIQSPNFVTELKPVKIGDNAWIGIHATILPGVTIGTGSVVAAGAVVTKDVPSFTVVAGIPAKKIGERNESLDYECHFGQYFV